MWQLLLVVLLLVAAVYFVLLVRSFQYMSINELRRQARAGKRPAARVYSARAYGMQLWVLLWILLGFVISAFILLLDVMLPVALALVIDVILLVVLHAVLPWSIWPQPSLKLAAQASPFLVRVLRLTQPVFRLVDKAVGKWVEPEPLKVIHSKDELLEVLAHTSTLVDQVGRDELEIAAHALVFGEKSINEVMTPRNMVKMIRADTLVSPTLLAELHDNGFSRLPVYDGDQSHFVGTLYVKDALKHKEGRHVRDIMRRDVYFVNERQTLDHVLSAFLRTHHHLFLVVNEYEDITGVITIEDVLEEILGKQIVDEFDQYEDLRAVARLTAEQRKKARQSEQV